jgi:serine/threonine protein kinase
VRFDNLRNEYFIMLEAQAIPEANTMFVTPIGSIWAGKLGNPGCVDEPDPIPVTYRIFDPGQRLLYFSAADGRPLPKCYHAFRGLITELCSGDFKWYLSKANPNRNLVAALEQNFVTAVKALHAAGIQHGDISTQNLLMCNGMLKLGDFGGSKREAAYTKAQWSNYLDVDRARVFDTLLAADQEFEPKCQPPMPALEFDCTVKNWVSHDRTCKLAANSWFLQWKEDGALEYKPTS